MIANRKRTIIGNKIVPAFAILTAILVMTLFSSFYIAKETRHVCTDKSCPVCAMIQQCEENLKEISTGLTACIVVAAVVVLFSQTVSLISEVTFFSTPITKKVRIND